jgi:exonuclease III
MESEATRGVMGSPTPVRPRGQPDMPEGEGHQAVQHQDAGEELVAPTWLMGREPEEVLWAGAAAVTVGQLRRFLETPQDVEARRHMFEVAWEIVGDVNDTVHHHFCRPRQPEVGVALPPPESTISLPLSFWRRLQGPGGKQADSVAGWLKTLGSYAPRKVVFPYEGMASVGSASWDVHGGRLRIYPVSTYTGKAWTSQEESRFRDAVTRMMGLSHGTVCTLRQVNVKRRETCRRPHLFRTTLARQLPTLLRTALPEHNVEVKLREQIGELLFRAQNKNDAQRLLEQLLGAAPFLEKGQHHDGKEEAPHGLPYSTRQHRGAVVSCNIGPRGWFGSQDIIRALVKSRPSVLLLQDVRLKGRYLKSPQFKKAVARVAPEYRAVHTSVMEQTEEDAKAGRAPYPLACVTLVHASGWSRTLRMEASGRTESKGRILGTLHSGQQGGSALLCINTYFPTAGKEEPFERCWEEIRELEREARERFPSLSVVLGGDMNGCFANQRFDYEGGQTLRTRDAQFEQHRRVNDLHEVQLQQAPGRGSEQPVVTFSRWSHSDHWAQGAQLDHFLVKLGNNEVAEAQVGDKPSPTIDHFPIWLRLPDWILLPTPQEAPRVPRQRPDMSQWASKRTEYTQQVATMFQDLGESIWERDEQQQIDPVRTWEKLGPLLVKIAGDVAGWRTLGGTGKAPFKDRKQTVLEAEIRAIDRVKNKLIGLRADARQDPASLLAREWEQLLRCNRSLGFVEEVAPRLAPGVELRRPEPGETWEVTIGGLRAAEQSRKQILRHIESAQVLENLLRERHKQGAEFPRAGTVQQVLGRVMPRVPTVAWDSHHPNVVHLSPGEAGDRIREYLRGCFLRGESRGAPPQLQRAWRKVPDAQVALKTAAGTNDGLVLEEGGADGSTVVLREPEVLAGMLSWISAQEDAEELRGAVTKIESWPDRLVTVTGMKTAMEHNLGNNSKSASLVCNNCRGPTEMVSLGDAGQGRQVSYLCRKCRRLVEPVKEPLKPFPFPRECLEGHDRRCQSEGYVRLRGSITEQGLFDILRTVKEGKAPGLDQVSTEMLKSLPAEARSLLLKMVNQLLTGAKVPRSWKGGEVTLLPKGGDRSEHEVSAHRPVTLLSVSYKFVEAILNFRLRTNVERFHLLEPPQEGFGRHKGTRRSLQGIAWRLQHLCEKKLRAILISLDWTGAFDSISLDALWFCLRGYGFEEADVQILSDFCGESWFRVALDVGATADIPTSKGSRQGALLSPMLFNLLLNVLLRRLQQAGISEEFSSMDPGMDATSAFADDLAAVVTTAKQGQDMVEICTEFAEWAEMKLNHKKCVCSSWDFQTHASFPVTIKVNQEAIKVVENGGSIKILGVLVSPKLDWKPQKAAVMCRQAEIALEVQQAGLQPHHMRILQSMALEAHFRYACCLCAWSRKELEQLAKLWFKVRNRGQGLQASCSRALCLLGQEDGGWGATHPRTIMFEELDNFARQLTRLPDYARRLFARDTTKALLRLGVRTVEAAARILAHQEPLEILESSVAARLIAAAAQMGLLPTWKGVMDRDEPEQDGRGEWIAELLQPHRRGEQWARAPKGLPVYDVEEQKVVQRPHHWEKVLCWCVERGLYREADLRSGGAWATPSELPPGLRPAFRQLRSTIERCRPLGMAFPEGRANIRQQLEGQGALRGVLQQAPEPVLERRMWETRRGDKVLWRERQRIFEEVGVYVRTGKAVDEHLDPAKHLRGKLRQQFDLLEECGKLLHDARQAENDADGGGRREEALRTVLRRFKESGGFLLAPASWWPDEEIGKQCGYWVMIPTGNITFQHIKEGDMELQKEEPHVELVAIDAWGCQIHCRACKKSGREATMMQEGCGCEGGVEPYTWRRETSKTLVPPRVTAWQECTLEALIQVSLDQDGRVVKESFEYFGVRQHDDPAGHPRWREKRAGGPGGGEAERAVLGEAGSQRQISRDHKLRRIAESSQVAWKHQQETVLGELQKPKSSGAAYQVGWVEPFRYPPLIFDRSDLQTKLLAKTEQWVVTERNLQASISRPGDAGQQEAKNEWEEADRKLGPKKKAATTDVVLEASKFKWLWGRRRGEEQTCIEAVVEDAVDAEERGQHAEPSTWKALCALQKLFNLETLVGENLVSWPPFFPKVVTPRTLQGGVRVESSLERKTPPPPPFVGSTTLEEAGPGPTLFLENELTSQELEMALSQTVGEELVLMGTWAVMGEAVSKHNANASGGKRLNVFHSLKKGMKISRKGDWWKTGDLEPCKNKSEVVLWWSAASQARVGGGGDSEAGGEVRTELAMRLQDELERGECPELEWDHRLRTDEIWSQDFEDYLSVGPASHLRLDKNWVVAATDGGVKVVQQEAGPDIARLGCGFWYRGYDLGRGEGARANLAFRGKEGKDSFQAEGEAMLGLLRKEREKKQPLAIMYDTDSLVQKIRSQTRDFGAPSPNDPKLRPVVKQIMEELSWRTDPTLFFKMKSHADCIGNAGADQLAEEGVQKEDAEADSWRPEDEGELGYMTLGPGGEVGGEYLSKRGTRTAARRELARQAKLGLEAKPEGRRTLTEKWLLRKGAGRQYLRLVWGMSGGASRVLAKAITFTLPVQANLHRWFPEKCPSAKCPFCGKENETYTHFTSHCEAFHLLRTREGMTFSKGSIEALGRELESGEGEWKVRTELTVGRMAEDLSSFHLEQDDALRTLRPDGWAWSFKHKCIIVLEHSRTDDTKLESDADPFNEPLPEELERLKKRAEEKVVKYEGLVQAIKQSYPEYTVQCAAFVIGAKLSFEEERWRKNLELFEERTPQGERRPALSEAAQERIIKRSVLAAARATVNCWHTRLKAPHRAAGP